MSDRKALQGLDGAFPVVAENRVVLSIAPELEPIVHAHHVGIGTDLVGDAVCRSLLREE